MTLNISAARDKFFMLEDKTVFDFGLDVPQFWVLPISA